MHFAPCIFINSHVQAVAVSSGPDLSFIMCVGVLAKLEGEMSHHAIKTDFTQIEADIHAAHCFTSHDIFI